MKPKTGGKPKIKRPALWSLLTIAALNYAEEAAKPLEAALIKAGAVKKCSRSAEGRGPDNYEPWYSGYYELGEDKEQATVIIEKITKDNGFTLMHSDSPYESIEWFTDDIGKNSAYPGIEPGKVRLSVNTYNDTNQKPLICLDGTQLKGDSSQTAFSLNLVLPTTKR
jgi:hypothetical protein